MREVERGVDEGAKESPPSWHSNVNMVTGVDATWLEDAFTLGRTQRGCVVSGVT